MNLKLTFVIVLILFNLSIVTEAQSQHGKIDVYYNGILYPAEETPKPILKIGEPFTVAIEMTVYQECKVYMQIEDLGTGLDMDNFIVVEGPSQLGESISRIYAEDESHTYEWTLKSTEEWAGGTMPIDIHYEIIEKGQSEPLVNSGFTAVLPHISTEYYEAPETTPAEPPETDTNQTPAFTLPAALLAIALVALRKKC